MHDVDIGVHSDKLTVGASLSGAVASSPYTFTLVISDGCNTDVTGYLTVYVFDDNYTPGTYKWGGGGSRDC